MLDPPSFSNSKRHDDFDVQRDHFALLELAMARLTGEGCLYFSTNSRRFKLDARALEKWQVSDITQQSIPEDFRRNQRIHACWRITHR
jgi:23S rRNA (guanine2445-N2)-methyltransferase / 23S rRNA (guanine2069-N7)-methyltransferase